MNPLTWYVKTWQISRFGVVLAPAGVLEPGFALTWQFSSARSVPSIEARRSLRLSFRRRLQG